jgi:hypothetical protein
VAKNLQASCEDPFSFACHCKKSRGRTFIEIPVAIANAWLVGHRLLPALQGAKSSSKEVDEEAKCLGGPRAILVRDKIMSDKLRPSLDESTLIMTILESKGMEFEDVILYDFFSTSPYKWDYGILEDIFVDYHVTSKYVS